MTDQETENQPIVLEECIKTYVIREWGLVLQLTVEATPETGILYNIIGWTEVELQRAEKAKKTDEQRPNPCIYLMGVPVAGNQGPSVEGLSRAMNHMMQVIRQTEAEDGPIGEIRSRAVQFRKEQEQEKEVQNRKPVANETPTQQLPAVPNTSKSVGAVSGA